MFDELDRVRKERANFQVQLIRFSCFLCCDHRALTFEIHWMHHLDYTSLAWNCPCLSMYVICCDFDLYATDSFYFPYRFQENRHNFCCLLCGCYHWFVFVFCCSRQRSILFTCYDVSCFACFRMSFGVCFKWSAFFHVLFFICSTATDLSVPRRISQWFWFCTIIFTMICHTLQKKRKEKNNFINKQLTRIGLSMNCIDLFFSIFH